MKLESDLGENQSLLLRIFLRQRNKSPLFLFFVFQQRVILTKVRRKNIRRILRCVMSSTNIEIRGNESCCFFRSLTSLIECRKAISPTVTYRLQHQFPAKLRPCSKRSARISLDRSKREIRSWQRSYGRTKSKTFSRSTVSTSAKTNTFNWFTSISPSLRISILVIPSPWFVSIFSVAWLGKWSKSWSPLLTFVVSSEPRLIQREELMIDWRIFYRWTQQLKSKKNQEEIYGLAKRPKLVNVNHWWTSPCLFSRNLEFNVIWCGRCCSPYFSSTATEEMLEEIRPQFCLVDWESMLEPMKALQCFLPVHLPPNLHDRGFKSLFSPLFPLSDLDRSIV